MPGRCGFHSGGLMCVRGVRLAEPLAGCGVSHP
jgi:hypothetical protein